MDYSFTERQQTNQTWVSHIEAGNVYFKNDDYAAAIAEYRQAIAMGKQLLQASVQQMQAPETIHLYIIACDNLARTYQELKQWADAETTLKQAYNSALDLIGRRDLPLQFRSEIYQGFRAAFERLMELFEQQGNRLSQDTLISQAQPSSLEFLRELNDSNIIHHS
jgi:tetratricopeptide (TPR) repeat protein